MSSAKHTVPARTPGAQRCARALAIVLIPLLTAASTSLGYAQNAVPASPAGGQIPPSFLSAREVVVNYLDTVYHRAAAGEPLSDVELGAFYITHLSVQTRKQVTEEQFIEFWQQLAKSHGRPGSIETTEYSVREPIQSESQDQALIPVTLSVTYNPPEGNAVLGFLFALFCLGAAFEGMSCIPPGSDDDYTAADIVTYRGVKEGGAWKLVLPDADVASMQKMSARVAGKRYLSNATASESGITVRAIEVAYGKDAASLRLAIENAGDEVAEFRNTPALATLTDDAGKMYGTRILRTTFPEAVQPRSSSAAALVFEPIPADSKTFTLALPDVHVGDKVVTLTLGIAPDGLPSQPEAHTPIPGEPVYFYVLTLFRANPYVRFGPPRGPSREALVPPARSDEALAALYRTYLASETRSQVTERQFVEFSQQEAIHTWEARLGEGRWYPHLGFGIGIDDPDYNATKDQASIGVTTTWGTRPGETKPDARTFRVVKEGGAWRLVLPEDLLRVVPNPALPAGAKRHVLEFAASQDAVTVRVEQAVIGKDSTTLTVTVENRADVEARLFTTIAGATLTDEQGKTYGTRILASTLPDQVPAGSSAAGTLVFDAVPLDAKKLRLVVPNISVGDRGLTLSLELPLEP